MVRFIASLTFGLLAAAPVAAHEFWIAPRDFTLDADQALVAELRVGEGMRGDTFPYLPPRFVRFDVIAGGETIPMPGRIGDDPAVNVSGLPDGLLELVYVSTGSEVTYSDAQTYARFIEDEGLDYVAARNAERGLDPVGLTEAFTRYAKSLVAVGTGRGEDRAAGLKIEIVSGLNPYRDDFSDGLPLQALLDGGPHAGARLRVLQRHASGEVTEDRYETDAEGRATVAVTPGASVLANVVWLEELAGPGTAAWHSHWASLTFAAPD